MRYQLLNTYLKHQMKKLKREPVVSLLQLPILAYNEAYNSNLINRLLQIEKDDTLHFFNWKALHSNAREYEYFPLCNYQNLCWYRSTSVTKLSVYAIPILN